MLKAILFDLDGTLIDSEHFYFECWNELLAEYGGKLTYDDWMENCSGKPLPMNAKIIVEKFDIPEPVDSVIKRREALTIERFRTTDVNLMPHAQRILDFFKSRGITMAVVTSSLRDDVDAIFARNGLGHYFKLIITRSEVVNYKPHPESYNLACETLGVGKDECIVFEDTINGLTSAKAANLVCYAVQSNVKEHHKLQAADKIFLDFKQVEDYLIESGQA
jgi:beta-phosphoglucomutase